MKSVLLLAVLEVVVFASLVSTKGCPVGKGICVEREFCLDYGNLPKGKMLHVCRLTNKTPGVCCNVSKTTLGKSCTFLNKFAGKCVPESCCHPYGRIDAWGTKQNVWNISNSVCDEDRAQNHYCCPEMLLRELDSTKLMPVVPKIGADIDDEKRNEFAASQMKTLNVFAICKTPDQQDGHYVPLQMCDQLYDLVRSGVHKTNRTFGKFLHDSICPTNKANKGTLMCCSNPANSSSYILHEKAAKLGMLKCGPVPMENKILLGEKVGLGQYPWMANLMYYLANRTYLETRCSGSLIHPRYVLTAASCKRKRFIPVAVRLGEYDLRSKTDCDEGECADPYKEYNITEWIAHSRYESGKPVNDIALIRLKTEVALEPGHIYPICLPLTASLLMLKPKKLLVTGWGQTESGDTSDILLKADLGNVDAQYPLCLESTICTRGVEMQAHCRGDSGGPLQAIVPFGNNYRTVLFGVASVGAKKCTVEGKTPGVSALVGYHIHWILDNMEI